MTKISPQVSIGMPVYNGEPFIREALDSLLAQTFTDFELIISDNASTDQTESICQEYVARDQRVRYVRQSENRGASANFQFVLDEAVGEYFMWAAADDRWSANWLELLCGNQSSEAGLVYGEMKNIDCSGRPVNPKAVKTYNFLGSRVVRRLSFLMNHFDGKANPIYGLFKKPSIVRKNISILGRPQSGCDMLFLYSLLEDTNIISVSGAILEKRLNQTEQTLIDERYGRANQVRPFHKRASNGLGLVSKILGEIYSKYFPNSRIDEKVLLIILAPAISAHACWKLLTHYMQSRLGASNR